MKPNELIKQNARAPLNQMRMADNQSKPANATNGVSFSELMRLLRGEG